MNNEAEMREIFRELNHQNQANLTIHARQFHIIQKGKKNGKAFVNEGNSGLYAGIRNKSQENNQIMTQCNIRVYNSTGSAIRYQAIPSSYISYNNMKTDEDSRIRYSYSHGGNDIYYIHLGEMAFIPIFSGEIFHHTEGNHTLELTDTVTTRESIQKSVTNSRTATITTTASSTTSVTSTLKVGLELNAKASYLGMAEVGFKETYEATGSVNKTFIDTTSSQRSTSLTDTITEATEYTYQHITKQTFPLTPNDREGYYRITMFSSADVYLYVVRNSKRELFYEYVEYVIDDPQKYIWRYDYSEDGKFDKNNDSDFSFKVESLDTLFEPSALYDPNIIVPISNLNQAIAWVRNEQNVSDGYNYFIEVNAIVESFSSTQTLAYSNRSNIGIIIRSKGSLKSTINLSADNVGSMFIVGKGVTLTLEDIILQGRTNNKPLVQVQRGGSLVMKTGSSIRSNTAGGVYIEGDATLAGGEITNNSNSSGYAGVYVSSGANFTMIKGKISGNSISTHNNGTGGAGGSPGGYRGEGAVLNLDFWHSNDDKAGGRGGDGRPGTGGEGGVGGVCVVGKFVIHGGEISNNRGGRGTNGGGGNGGAGGYYSSNVLYEASGGGGGGGAGGVALRDKGSFVMYGGEIKNNLGGGGGNGGNGGNGGSGGLENNGNFIHIGGAIHDNSGGNGGGGGFKGRSKLGGLIDKRKGVDGSNGNAGATGATGRSGNY